MLQRARAATAFFGVLLVALIWVWARRLFGPIAGWLAAGLAAFSPTLLAHAGLATSDVVVTACFLAAVSAFWRLWHQVTWPRLALAGVAAGATFLSKTSGVLLVPMLALLLAIRLMRPTPLHLRVGGRASRSSSRSRTAVILVGASGAAGVLAFAIIWAGYQFRFAAAPDAERQGLTFDPSWETLLEANAAPAPDASAAQSLIESGIKSRMPAAIAGTVSWLREYRVLPEAYLWSVAFTFQASRTRPSFFWGESSETGSRWFFPGAFLLKTTPPELVLFAAGVLAVGWRTLSGASQPSHRRTRLRLVYRSGYDWGQGLPALQHWIETRKANGDSAPIFLSYFGSDSPRARGLPVTRVADWRDDSGPRNYPAPLRGGWFAISATNFQRVYLGVAGPWSPLYEQRYQDIGRTLPPDAESAARLTEAQRAEWMRNAMLFEILQFGRVCHFLRDRRPDEIVGESILIFPLTDDEVARALASPLADAPAALSAR